MMFVGSSFQDLYGNHGEEPTEDLILAGPAAPSILERESLNKQSGGFSSNLPMGLGIDSDMIAFCGHKLQTEVASNRLRQLGTSFDCILCTCALR